MTAPLFPSAGYRRSGPPCDGLPPAKKPLPKRRTRSLERSQDPRKDSESWDCPCLSLHSTYSKKELRRTSSDGAGCFQSLAQPAEAQGTMATALSLEETNKPIRSEQSSPQDTKKDKAHRRAQPGLLKVLFNFFLRTSPEEPKDKASRRPKRKESLSQPVESPVAPGQPAVRKKSQDKKPSRKKASGHKKHVTEETKGVQDQEAASHPEESDLGPARKGSSHNSKLTVILMGRRDPGRENPDLPECLFTEGRCAGVQTDSSQATGHKWEAERQLSEDAIIQMIVELIKKIGDEWEEERLRTQQLETGLQNQAPVFRKKSQEKKSSFRRAFILKKQGSEEPKRVGAADVPSLETRTPKRPSFLPLCVGGHRPSTSSSTDLEEPQVPDVRSPTALKITPGARSRWPEEELEPDRASESSQYSCPIFSGLQTASQESPPQRLQTQQPEVDVENPASIFRKKSQEKKSSFRRAFIYKKQSSKESKRVGAADVSSPEARTPKRPSFLPLCVGGQRPSVPDLDLEDIEFQKLSPAERGPIGSPEPASQTRSHKPEGEPQLEGACESMESLFQKLVALLQKVDNQLGKQIRRHPSFETFLYKLSDSSVTKLIATLQSREAHPPEPDKSLDEKRYQFAASLANKFAGNNSHVICLLGHYSWHLYPWFPYEEAQLNITSPESQSPD
uniref:BCL2 interacting protein 5 n=1 Tax=Loxodonta africana TaxID=9785 RepID=G3T488_LOXAF